LVVVLLGGELIMEMAMAIGRTGMGEHELSAHHPRGYSNERRLTLAPFFAPKTTETPIKPKPSEPMESSHWLVVSEWIAPRTLGQICFQRPTEPRIRDHTL
jgi:hypothetical protein